jgi:hypothetical protein
MTESPDLARIEQIDRLMQEPRRRERLESNCSRTWELLQSQCQPLLLNRALLWSPWILRLPILKKNQDDPHVQNWLSQTFITVAFARFRERCLKKPIGDPRKGGIPPGSPARYLLKILLNELIAHASKRPVVRYVQADVEATTADSESTFDKVLRNERLQRLRDCIKRLPTNHRRAIKDAYLDSSNKTHDQLANEAGVGRQAFQEWLQKAKAALRKCIDARA